MIVSAVSGPTQADEGRWVGRLKPIPRVADQRLVRWLKRDDETGFLVPDWPGYLLHLDAIKPKLPQAPLALAETDLHDGLIEKLTVNQGKQTVKLQLVVGDLERGYRRARIKYRGATLQTRGADLRWLVGYDATEVLGDEIDITGTGFVHRLVFWPAGEIHISFDAVEFATVERPDRTRRTPRLRWR